MDTRKATAEELREHAVRDERRLDDALAFVEAHKAAARRLERASHTCRSVTTADGHGAYCEVCGETLA